MSVVRLKINGIDVEAAPGTSLLDAARQAGIEIPSLCYLKEVNCVGACRMCLVEIRGRNALAAACSTKVADGMEVQTTTPEIERIRKQNLELICSNHRQDCSRCTRFPYCELHTLCRRYEIDDRQNMFNRKPEPLETMVHLERDPTKCILCRRCVSMCRSVQGVSAISVLGKGTAVKVSSAYGGESDCIHCGQCILACPTAALTEKNDTRAVGAALSQQKKHVIAVVTDAAAAQLGEYFGSTLQEPASKGKTAAALRRLGFRAVYDAGEAAAPSVYAQCAELLRRVERREGPLISAACPSVKEYCRRKRPDLAENLSAEHSPVQAAALACRDHYAGTHGVPLEAVSVVTVSSCTADKYERSLPVYCDAIDAALTSHEMDLLFERACISSFSARQVWSRLPEEAYDSCRDGGDAAAGATVSQILPQLGAVCVEASHPLPGNPAVSEAVYEYKHVRFKTARAAGMKAAAQLLDGASGYAWIEAFACPGGCRNGAGRNRQCSGGSAQPLCGEGETE